jgi:uncharacterized protein YndB with AHSA1/START domain
MKTNYTIVPEHNQLIAQRSFAAPKSKVWQYYTTAELLDLWWAPAPYKAITKSFDFTPGGHWHYIMQGPDASDAHHCINVYKTIDAENSFTAFDGFANPDWTINNDLPGSDWEVTFTQNGDMTDMKMVLTTKDKAGLDTLIEMGMKEGYNQGLDQLEALLTK